ncbi:MAG TPA: hypothetical protein DCM64_12370 [Gammaproteobacteria bacterium]|mgnify:CR=1 FL=1|nr:hypothetical protein [Gammaproteobacteria bacterium]MDP6731548.1 hypothetical protein [Gammaproteobacteria bacterium]HAJ77235.1 hypothetical protein [Gammaproteobacteria bacterium]|tara:strand:+ start:499 stop:888 length:390 start_codon:yes stop_codon:yes gene_type:complete
MKIVPLVFWCSLSFLAACSSAPFNVTGADTPLVDYRYFLTGLSNPMHAADNGFGDTRAEEILQLREEIILVMGTARTFDDFEEEQYSQFVRLSRELYKKMCSDQRFVNDRASLYEMLLNPDVDSRLASL